MPAWLLAAETGRISRTVLAEAQRQHGLPQQTHTIICAVPLLLLMVSATSVGLPMVATAPPAPLAHKT